MAALQDLSSELRVRFDLLRVALDAPDEGCGPAADEAAWFRLVDEVAASPEAPETLLEDIGNAFARCFVIPYLHMTDLRGVLAEVAGLLAVHHRGRLTVERLEGDHALIGLRVVTDHPAGRSPGVFDLTVLRAALASALPGVRVEATKAPDRFRVQAR